MPNRNDPDPAADQEAVDKARKDKSDAEHAAGNVEEPVVATADNPEGDPEVEPDEPKQVSADTLSSPNPTTAAPSTTGGTTTGGTTTSTSGTTTGGTTTSTTSPPA